MIAAFLLGALCGALSVLIARKLERDRSRLTVEWHADRATARVVTMREAKRRRDGVAE